MGRDTGLLPERAHSNVESSSFLDHSMFLEFVRCTSEECSADSSKYTRRDRWRNCGGDPRPIRQSAEKQRRKRAANQRRIYTRVFGDRRFAIAKIFGKTNGNLALTEGFYRRKKGRQPPGFPRLAKLTERCPGSDRRSAHRLCSLRVRFPQHPNPTQTSADPE